MTLLIFGAILTGVIIGLPLSFAWYVWMKLEHPYINPVEDHDEHEQHYC